MVNRTFDDFAAEL